MRGKTLLVRLIIFTEQWNALTLFNVMACNMVTPQCWRGGAEESGSLSEAGRKGSKQQARGWGEGRLLRAWAPQASLSPLLCSRSCERNRWRINESQQPNTPSLPQGDTNSCTERWALQVVVSVFLLYYSFHVGVAYCSRSQRVKLTHLCELCPCETSSNHAVMATKTNNLATEQTGWGKQKK